MLLFSFARASCCLLLPGSVCCGLLLSAAACCSLLPAAACCLLPACCLHAACCCLPAACLHACLLMPAVVCFCCLLLLPAACCIVVFRGKKDTQQTIFNHYSFNQRFLVKRKYIKQKLFKPFKQGLFSRTVSIHTHRHIA